MYVMLILVGLAVGAHPVLGQEPPECDADGPYSGDVSELIQFDGTGSSAPGGWIVLYEWQFGDGATAQGPAPQHAYSNAGLYTVTLRVTDNNGAFSNCQSRAEVGPVPVEPSSWGQIKAYYSSTDAISKGRGPDAVRMNRKTVMVEWGGSSAAFTLDDSGESFDRILRYQHRHRTVRPRFRGIVRL